jgi:hypothetical protein
LPAHRARRVHRVLAAQPPETGFTEDVFARVNLVWLVQQVQANGTDDSVIKFIQLGFGFENVLGDAKIFQI